MKCFVLYIPHMRRHLFTMVVGCLGITLAVAFFVDVPIFSGHIIRGGGGGGVGGGGGGYNFTKQTH